MKYKNNIYETNVEEITLDEIYELIKDENAQTCVNFIRNEPSLEKRREFKKNLPLILAEDGFYWVDIDGLDHLSGNDISDLDLGEICSLVPCYMAFISTGGEGFKLLIKSNYSPINYIQETLSKEGINVKIDRARTDMTFISYDPNVMYEKQELIIPVEYVIHDKVEEEKNFLPIIQAIKKFDINVVSQLLQSMEDRYDYKTWLALVGSILSTFGEEAIPYLQKKWVEDDFSYKTMLTTCRNWNNNILTTIWNRRIRKNYYNNKKMRVVGGPTGVGKSLLFIGEVIDDKSENYFIYVTPSVKQAIDMMVKLNKNGITNEILVSEETKEKYQNDFSIYVHLKTQSSNNTKVKIITKANAVCGGADKWMKLDSRKCLKMTFDELVMNDFLRPSILNSALVRQKSGKVLNSDLIKVYDSEYPNDYKYAESLAFSGDNSGFIGCIFGYDVAIDVLSTEELTVKCLKDIGFEEIRLGNDRLHELKESTINIYHSSLVVKSFLTTNAYKNFITKGKYDVIISDADELADFNHYSSKGLHISKRNLVVLRHFGNDREESIRQLYSSVFKDGFDPVNISYYDLLLNSCGRSIGFRGQKEVYVIINQGVFYNIQHYLDNGYYSYKDQELEIDDKSQNEIITKRKLTSDRINNAQKVQKNNRDMERKVVVTQKLKKGTTRLTSANIRDKLGFGKLEEIAKILGIEVKRNGGMRFIEADWII